MDEHNQPHPPEPSAPGLRGPEDDAPLPELDPATDEQVRALLAETGTDPSPGPMPDDVAERIVAAIAHEERLRVDPGPLAGGSAGAAVAVGSVVPFAPRTRRQQRPWVAVGAVAAAAAVIAVGGSLLHANKRTDPTAVVIGDRRTSAPATPTNSGAEPSATTSPTSTPATTANPHIQLSTTDYTAGTLAARARALLDAPATALPDLAAEAPSIGPIATPVGLASCLDAIAAGPGAVTVDLATFEGQPAAIIVVTAGGASTAYAVGRSCAPGNVKALAPATPVP
ncbi:MAG: hypothetical protein ABI336_11410 [Humibacillus sp.]